MPALILLNGPPGIGKSTLARQYAEAHPLALNLDIDRIRDLIGCWRDHAGSAGLLARSIALAAARTHLDAQHDVVIPQFLGRLAFIEQAEDLARQADADFHEIVLLDTLENALRRFDQRAHRAEEPGHVDDARMLDVQGGRAELAAMYERLLQVIAARPGTKTVRSSDGRPDQAYRDFLACLT